MDSMYKSFLSRVNLTIWIILVIILIIALQNTLAEEIKIGMVVPRNARQFVELALANEIWFAVKVLVLVPIIVFWLLDKRRLLRFSLLLSLALLTTELLASVALLVISLGGDTPSEALGLMRDTLTVGIINILVFSLWYWIVD